jgi:hypothetical protein
MQLELIFGAAGVGLIFLCTISSLSSLFSSLLKARQYGAPQVYADEDGISTEELTAKFTTKFSKIGISLFSCLGLGVAISLAILGTLGLSDDSLFIGDWLNAGSWVNLTRLLLTILFADIAKVSDCHSSCRNPTV